MGQHTDQSTHGEELPPYSSGPSSLPQGSSSRSRPLSKDDTAGDKTSAGGVTLDLTDRPYLLGDVIPMTLSIDAGVMSSLGDEATISIEGRSQVTVMGKMRWQVAQAVSGLGNVGMMGPGTIITNLEEHVFASTNITIPLKGKGETPGVRSTESSGQVRWDIHSLSVPRERTCSCTQANPLASPTIKAGMGPLGQNLAAAGWRLKVKIKRKGMLHRDIRLSKALAVAANAVDAVDQYREASSPLKHRSPTEQPVLHASLHVPVTPPQADGLYDFTLRLVTLPSPSILKSSITAGGVKIPQVDFNVSRHVWTVAVENPSLGDKGGFGWAGERIATVSNDRRHDGQMQMAQTDDGLAWTGSIRLPFVQISNRACAFSVHYSLNANVSWPEMMKEPLMLGVRIAVPSTGRLAQVNNTFDAAL